MALQATLHRTRCKQLPLARRRCCWGSLRGSRDDVRGTAECRSIQKASEHQHQLKVTNDRLCWVFRYLCVRPRLSGTSAALTDLRGDENCGEAYLPRGESHGPDFNSTWRQLGFDCRSHNPGCRFKQAPLIPAWRRGQDGSRPAQQNQINLSSRPVSKDPSFPVLRFKDNLLAPKIPC
jgi:hypothetical protein